MCVEMGGLAIRSHFTLSQPSPTWCLQMLAGPEHLEGTRCTKIALRSFTVDRSQHLQYWHAKRSSGVYNVSHVLGTGKEKYGLCYAVWSHQTCISLCEFSYMCLALAVVFPMTVAAEKGERLREEEVRQAGRGRRHPSSLDFRRKERGRQREMQAEKGWNGSGMELQHLPKSKQA